MEWLVILGLGAWVWLQSRRIRTLTLELTELKRAFARGRTAPVPGEIDDEPLLLTEVVRDDELLLDAPLPTASNDDAPETALGAFAWPNPPSLAEAGAVLATALVLLTPALADLGAWSPSVITALIGLTAAAGFAVAGWRRWPWLAVMTLTGIYLWFAFALGGGDISRAIMLLAFAALGGAAMGVCPPRNGDANSFGWSQVHAALPAIAIVTSSVLTIWTWFDTSVDGTGLILAPTILGVGLALLAALAVRRQAAAPPTFVVSIAALVVGFMAHLNVREGALSAEFYPLLLASALMIAALVWIARASPESRALIAGTGAIGAGLLALLAAFSRADWHGPTAYAPLFSAAAVLFVFAWLSARTALDAKEDAVVDVWVGVGAALALLGVESAFSEPIRVVVHALFCFVFAIGYMRFAWRALRFATLIFAGVALGHAISPALFQLAGDGALTLVTTLAFLGATAILFFGASRMAARVNPSGATVEALAFAMWLTPVIGAFYLLHWLNLAGTLDAFVANAWRALVLLGAGVALLPRASATVGDVGRWRGHALLLAGLAFALFWAGFMLNPWWGGQAAASIAGPPLFNAQALAFLAPAALAFYAASRTYARDLEPARIYVSTGALLSVMWAVIEIRRVFRDDSMSQPAIGVFEAAFYALLFIAIALIVTITARVRASRDPERPFTRDLLAVMRPITWATLAGALVLMLGVRHPWWGAQDGAVTGPSSVGWSVMAQVAATALSLWLARALSISRPAEPARFAAAAAAALFALSFGLGAVRWLYHRGRMDDGVSLVGLEGLAYAVWPLLLVSAAAYYTARAPGRDAERAYLYDLQAIWATAIWPAMAFACFGLWAVFNPWWGAWPAHATNLGGFITIIAAFGLASCLSIVARRVPYARYRDWLRPIGVAIGAAHIAFAATMMARRLFHHESMSAAPATILELWVYAAVWASLAIAAFVVGTRRENFGLRWFSLGAIVVTIAYTFFISFTRMTGGAQAGAILSVAMTPFVVMWATRRFKMPPPPIGPNQMATITPGQRRDKRHGRRYRTP